MLEKNRKMLFSNPFNDWMNNTKKYLMAKELGIMSSDKICSIQRLK